MNKCIKIILVLVMILGIVFSILNFNSVNVNAEEMWGIKINGECQYIGNKCRIGDGFIE